MQKGQKDKKVDHNYTPMEVCQLMALTLAQVKFGRLISGNAKHSENPNIRYVNIPIAPNSAVFHGLEEAFNLANASCFEAVGLAGNRVVLYARDPRHLTVDEKDVWEEVVETLKDRVNLEYQIVKFLGDFRPTYPDEGLAGNVWNFFGPFLESFADGSEAAAEDLLFYFGVDVKSPDSDPEPAPTV